MENSFQTSFIPKKPVTTGIKAHGAPISLLTVFSVIVLIAIGGGAGGLFVYKNYLIKQKADLAASLLKIQESFKKDTVDELDLYDKRASTAKQLLDNHIVLSPLFVLLGNLTLPEIQYTQFSHETTNEGFSVALSGVASSYRSIALQADVFNSAKGRTFKNVVFSNLVKNNKDNTVTFNLAFTVDPTLLSYEKNLALEKAQASTKPQNTTTQETSPVSSTKNTQTPPPDNTNTNNPTP